MPTGGDESLKQGANWHVHFFMKRRTASTCSDTVPGIRTECISNISPYILYHTIVVSIFFSIIPILYNPNITRAPLLMPLSVPTGPPSWWGLAPETQSNLTIFRSFHVFPSTTPLCTDQHSWVQNGSLGKLSQLFLCMLYSCCCTKTPAL